MKFCGRSSETDEVITVTTEAGEITNIQSGLSATALGGADVWLSPGFCDLQINGYGGFDFNLAVWGQDNEVSNEPEPLLQKLMEAGTALVCPTLTTNSHNAIVTALKKLTRVLDANPTLEAAVPSIHLEGPYISPEDGPRGAHPREHVRDPDWDEFQRFQGASGGTYSALHTGPGETGRAPLIEKLTLSGVIVALGHTGAEPETIREAVRAAQGLLPILAMGHMPYCLVTRTNIWEQLACDELTASLILDGHHLPPSVAKAMARVKGADRLALVSDAVALGGLVPGVYADGRYEVLPGGKIVTVGTPYLAGAGHLLDVCIPNALQFTDLSLAQVIRCVTTIPARILGLEGRKGHLRIGYDADLTIFRILKSGPLDIVATLCSGQLVYPQ